MLRVLCLRLLLLTPLTILVAGCGSSPPPPPKPPDTVPFTGIVKMDGAPLAGATVNFNPTFEKGWMASGVTDGEGKYDLKIRNGEIEKAGAATGNYKVTISRFLSPSGQPQDPTKPTDVPGMESIPQRYSSPNATELKAEVAAGKTADFNLKSK